LLPGFQFVPGLLRGFFIRTKIKFHVGMCHTGSLERPRHQVKIVTDPSQMSVKMPFASRLSAPALGYDDRQCASGKIVLVCQE
jgi:hypothetical protein